MKKPTTGEWKFMRGAWHRKVLRVQWERNVCLTCVSCSKEFLTKHPESSTCSPKCRAKFRWSKVPEAARIKNKTRKHSGYIEVYEPSSPMADQKGWVGEHRMIMADILGRPLTKGEFVHHINGRRDDNRPENLIVMSAGDHNSHHKTIEASNRKRNAQGKFT